MIIICGFVTQEQFITKLKEVARMVESLITTNPLVGVFLVVAGVRVSSSPV